MSSITYQVTVSPVRTEWYLNGKLHREDGPAIEYANGDRFWFQTDRLHRIDGPASEYANGQRHWFQNGKPHRIDGPASEYADGQRYWYLNGQPVTEEEHQERTQPAKELTMEELEKILGHRVKIVK